MCAVNVSIPCLCILRARPEGADPISIHAIFIGRVSRIEAELTTARARVYDPGAVRMSLERRPRRAFPSNTSCTVYRAGIRI